MTMTIQVTIAIPIKRGLKVQVQMVYNLLDGVTIAIPIKRGLKAESVAGIVTQNPVTIAIPIKRGLKDLVNIAIDSDDGCYNCYPD